MDLKKSEGKEDNTSHSTYPKKGNSNTWLKSVISIYKNSLELPQKLNFSKLFSLTTLKLIGILFLLFLITLGILIHFIYKVPSPNDPDGKIQIEIIKGLLDVLVVIIIGSTIAALFKAYERNIEQTKIHSQMKLDFIKRIGKLYRKAKTIRRKLRTEGIKIEKDHIELTLKQYEFYSNQMNALNDVQLEIEGFKIASKNSFLFPGCKPITIHLLRMEVYLNKIHGEFEEQNANIKRSELFDMTNLYFLQEFTSSATNHLLTDKLIYSKLIQYEPKSPEGKTHYCFKNIFSNSYANLLKEMKY
ncbi:MAG: hypothetical protein ABJB16_17700 [Saprospiraceae bacterium]